MLALQRIYGLYYLWLSIFLRFLLAFFIPSFASAYHLVIVFTLICFVCEGAAARDFPQNETTSSPDPFRGIQERFRIFRISEQCCNTVEFC